MRISLTAFVAAAGALACEDEGRSILGTYDLVILETRDTCDREINEFRSEATISREGRVFVVEFGQEARLMGEISEEGVLVAQGDIVVVRRGVQIAGFMQIGLVIRDGRIREGAGRLTFNGTFPGVPGTCAQDFNISGSRRGSAVPLIG